MGSFVTPAFGQKGGNSFHNFAGADFSLSRRDHRIGTTSDPNFGAKNDTNFGPKTHFLQRFSNFCVPKSGVTFDTHFLANIFFAGQFGWRFSIGFTWDRNLAPLLRPLHFLTPVFEPFLPAGGPKMLPASPFWPNLVVLGAKSGTIFGPDSGVI